MTNTNRMELRTADDRDQATVELWMNGQPLGHIFLPASDLEGHIRRLADHRANLADEVPRTLDPRSRLNAVFDPIWKIPDPSPAEGKLLALRHPGLGWLGFVVPHNEAREIAKWLLKDLPEEQPKEADPA